MRVLVINNVYPSLYDKNAYVFVQNQVVSLIKNGYEVFVLDIDLRSFKHKRKYGIYKEIYNNVQVYRVSFPFFNFNDNFFIRFFNKLFGKLLFKKIVNENGKIDFVNAHFALSSGFAAYSIKKKYGIPYVITEHHTQILIRNTSQLKNATKIYNYANYIIAVSVALKNKILKLCNNKNICVIPNIIDVNKFTIEEHSKNKKTNSFSFISIGHLIERKGHDLVITALSEIQKDYPNVSLTIIGRGNKEVELKKLVKKLNVKNIKFISQVPNDKICSFLNDSDCFVLASRQETFGVVYAEAISCGIPVIATRCCGPEEFVNKINGLLIDVNNLDSLVLSMKYMIKNAKLYDKKKVRKTIVDVCSEEAFICNISKVYEEMYEKLCN